MKINDRVTTILGVGTVIDFEKCSDRYPRVGVKLDDNIFGWEKNCYYFFWDEVENAKSA